MPADLRTIKGVELVRTGTWSISTGTWTVTAEDLRSAVEAHAAGVLRRPVLKIGHTDPRFDGGPALGRVDFLRLADAGNTLIGDFVDVPAAVAKLLPHSYPSRSVEARLDYVDADGRTWPLVIEAVALLGETAPGVSSLADVADLFGVAASSGRRVTIAAAAFRPSDDAARARAVAVAAARRRRTHRTTIGV